MHAYRVEVMIPESHEVMISLPHDIPVGKAELIVLSTAFESAEPATTVSPVNPVNDSSLAMQRINALHQWINQLSEIPAIPLEMLDRGELY